MGALADKIVWGINKIGERGYGRVAEFALCCERRSNGRELHMRMIGFAAAVLVLAFAAASSAAADSMAGLYGNTIVCTYPSGAITKVYPQEGGVFTVVRGGKTITGTWLDDGVNVCYTETNPAPPPGTKNVCVASKAWKVGDGWQVTDPTGATCNAILMAGHQ